ncbi:unnamed protein product [marine sediment metagenome]|uniref:Uncharacterized protein n=1 Tax=marine sediment metagenome TaxID=412755 RepID=X1CAM7_9ZZZZ
MGEMVDYRWYKGKSLVEVIKRSKGNYLVLAIDECKAGNKEIGYRIIKKGEQFTTVPRLLYYRKREKTK